MAEEGKASRHRGSVDQTFAGVFFLDPLALASPIGHPQQF
jgi:hypothetical protein